MDLSEHLTDLLRPAAFAHPARDIRLVETHISWVIMAGDFAYKLRKPVNFGFLDFSTPEQRRADCEAEVALNRRLAPEMYLGVVDVVAREDGHLYVGGHGTAVEPAVQMLRLPQAGMLPALIERGDADERLMQRIAERLAEFHACAPTGPGIDEYASLAALRANWDENFAQVHPSELLDAARERSIRCYVNGFLRDNAALLAGRVQTGRIRDGHGDLHAASVCLARGRLYLFDCIEFNARYRCADVAAEVAFLAMDLEHLGRADLAFPFVHAYVRSSQDSDLQGLLPFYKTYRAFVRGKVLALRLAEPGLDASTASETRKQARAYFDLAYAYAQPLHPRLLIVTMGMPASGKTTLANALAGHLGIPHISSDVVRKQMVGVRPTTHRMEAFLTGMYTPAMTRRTYAIMRRYAARYLRRGMSVVLDATYGQPAERAALRRLARRLGAEVLFIICRADEDVLKQRLLARRADPHTTSDARMDVWPALRAAFVEPTELPMPLYADMSQPLEEVLERVLGHIYAAQSAHAKVSAA